MGHVCTPESFVLFNILDNQCRFIDNRIFGDTGIEIDPIA